MKIISEIMINNIEKALQSEVASQQGRREKL